MEGGRPLSGAGKFTAHGSVKPDFLRHVEHEEPFRKRQATAVCCLPALTQWLHPALGLRLQTYHAMAEAYDRYGYNLIMLPPGGPEERAEFILSCL